MPRPWKHGTNAGYKHHKCRCEPCTKAHRIYDFKQRENRKQRLKAGLTKIKHGIRSTYTNHGCRCALCVEVNKKSCVKYRTQKCQAKNS